MMERMEGAEDWVREGWYLGRGGFLRVGDGSIYLVSTHELIDLLVV